MDINEEYKKIINEFLQATKAEKLNWKKQNPTTVYIETASNSEKAIISIQKIFVKAGTYRSQAGQIVRRESQTNFVFIVKNASTNELVMQIDTSTDSSLREILSVLFEVAVYSTEKKNVDFLKGIINNIDNKK